MRKLDLERVSKARLDKYAVQFDQNVSYQDQDAWPYWYALIPSPFEETDQLNGGLGIMGFELEPGQIKDLAIKTDRDTAFRFINTKWDIATCNVEAINAGAAALTAAAGNVNVTAAGSFAATDVGRKIIWENDNGVQESGIIAVFNTVNDVDLAAAPTAAATAVTFNFSNVGTVAIAAGSNAVVGTNTAFTTDYEDGDRFAYTDVNGITRCARIFDITSPFNMELHDIQEVGSTSGAHSKAKWEWWTAIGGTAPIPQIPITFKSNYTPLTRFLEVKLNIPSLRNVDFYGDNQYQSNGGMQERMLPLTVLQGEKDGNPMLRTPDALLPTEATIGFQALNNHSEVIHVNAVCFGYKISMHNDSGA